MVFNQNYNKIYNRKITQKGFLPEAYFEYVEDRNPRRTTLIGKIAISQGL